METSLAAGFRCGLLQILALEPPGPAQDEMPGRTREVDLAPYPGCMKGGGKGVSDSVLTPK